jgi:DNA-binding CsgD family transcriptional regulator
MLDLVTAIHRCALRPEGWHDTLGKVLDYMESKGGMLWSHQAAPDAFGLWVTCRLDPVSLEEYARHYHAKDVWMQAGLARGPRAGEVMTGDMLVPRAAFLESEFYRDFLRRYDCVHLLYCMLHAPENASGPVPMVHFSMYRGEADTPFGEADRRKLQALLPHLQESTAINFHLADREHRLDVAQAAVDLFGDALFFADQSGRVVHANRAAHALLAQDDGLHLRDGLLAANGTDTPALQSLLGGADEEGSTDLLPIPRPSGKQPFLAVRMRVTADASPRDARRPQRVVLIHDPETHTPARVATLRKRYGLTEAETHTLTALLKTGSAKAMAALMGLSVNTVRSHLKSIYNKTGVGQKSELVQLVLSVPRL